LPDTQHINSYYAQTANCVVDRGKPSTDLSADVCVVGAGFAGLASALSLAERGANVVLLEARRVGWGASGRNGGFVGAGFSLGGRALINKVGLEDARELYELSRDGAALIKSRIEQYKISCPPNDAGALRPSRFDTPDRLRRERDFMAEQFGEQDEFWCRERVREALVSERYFDALFKPDTFQFHPLNYCLGLAEALERHGVTIIERATVTGFVFDQPEKLVRTASGTVKARDVVIACGGYLGNLVPRLRRATVPIATYVLVTEPLGEEQMNNAIRVPYSIADNKFAEDYYRRLPDTRVMWGGRISVRQSRPPDLSALMLKDLLKIYPQLTGIRAESAWHGLMSYAAHKMPQIGQLSPGVWHAMGFGGHGTNTTSMAGELIASAIRESDDRYRLFEPFGLTPTGGPIGAAAAQLTYWYYQSKDVLHGV